MIQLKRFEQQIKSEIPLTQALEFEFYSFEKDVLVLKAPYLPNKNDKHTVFAGSQASLALLSGWSLVNLLFQEHGLKSVAAVKTEMHYKKPIEKDFFISAKLSEDSDPLQISSHLEKKGRAKAGVDVELMEELSGEVQAVFSASYFISQ